MSEPAATVRVDEGGGITIPPEFLDTLGLKPGDRLRLELAGDELRIVSVRAGLRRAQELMRPYLSGTSMADELIAQRREEARREDARE
jgi:AbrB family looped-hinge helix DNA binding protein